MPFNLQLFLRPSRFLFPALPSEMGRVGEEVGARRPKVTITLKLLDWEERKKALERCAADWKQLPRHYKPIELLREAVDAERLDRPRSAAELKTGQLVACRHQGRAFKAEVVQVLNPREIRVRLRGSKEELSVGLGSIQLLPPESPP